MGLAFLPWEKLPPWFLGPLLTAWGVFILFHDEPYSSERVWAGAMFIAGGIGLFTYGIWKLRANRADAAAED